MPHTAFEDATAAVPKSKWCGNGTYPADVPSYAWRPAVSVAAFAAIMLYAVVFAALMCWRRKVNPVRARSLPLIMLSGFAGLVMAILRGTEETFTPPEFPCDAAFFTAMLFPMCISPPVLLRLIRISQLYRHASRMQLISSKDIGWEDELRRLERWTKDRPLLFIAIAACVPYIVATIAIYATDDTLGNGCSNCDISKKVVFACAILAFVFSIPCVVMLWMTRASDDTLHLRAEIFHGVVLWTLLLVGAFIFNTVPYLRDIQDGGILTPGVWYVVGALVYFTLLVTFPTLGTWNIGPYKSYAKRYGFLPTPSRRASAAGLSVDDALADMDAGPSDNVEEWELIDFLSQADATAAFMAHLASEFSVESLKFWLHAGEFADSANHWAAGGGEEQPQSVAREHMLMRATWILETYILDDAPLRVNVSYAQQQKVQAQLAAGEVSTDMFNECRREIYLLMERDPFPRFRRSRRFAAFKAARSAASHKQHGKKAACCSTCGCLGGSRKPRGREASRGDQELVAI